MDAAKVLADHVAYVEARDVDGNSAWHLYVSRDLFNTPDDVWCMKLLKDLQIDVNMRNKDRSSPLHVAAFFGKPACVYGLIIPRQGVGNLGATNQKIFHLLR